MSRLHCAAWGRMGEKTQWRTISLAAVLHRLPTIVRGTLCQIDKAADSDSSSLEMEREIDYWCTSRDQA